jgi:hypothetical protein
VTTVFVQAVLLRRAVSIVSKAEPGKCTALYGATRGAGYSVVLSPATVSVPGCGSADGSGGADEVVVRIVEEPAALDPGPAAAEMETAAAVSPSRDASAVRARVRGHAAADAGGDGSLTALAARAPVPTPDANEDFEALARAIAATCLVIIFFLLLPVWVAVPVAPLGAGVVHRGWAPAAAYVRRYTRRALDSPPPRST